MTKRILAVIFFMASFIYASPSYSQNADVVGSFSDWRVHVYSDPQKKICFVSSQPKEMAPKNVKRGVVVFYISNWPRQKVEHEISVDVGYPLKAESQPTAIIGSDTFKFIVKADKAFVETPEQEKKMFEAMKRGSEMVFKGMSSRGTNTMDKYSLAGLSAALEKVSTTCK